jgi:hypothetical protein
MAKRGRCQCGATLRFQKTARGYKTRCRQCGAVVRLRAKQAPSELLAAGAGPRSGPAIPAPPLPAGFSINPPTPPPADPDRPIAVVEMEICPQPPARDWPGWRFWLCWGIVLVVVTAVSTVVFWISGV